MRRAGCTAAVTSRRTGVARHHVYTLTQGVATDPLASALRRIKEGVEDALEAGATVEDLRVVLP